MPLVSKCSCSTRTSIKLVLLVAFVLTVLNLLSKQASLSVKPMSEPSKIVNPHSFSYLINPARKICMPHKKRHTLTLIVTVPSEPHSSIARQLVRQTWANPLYLQGHVKLAFMLGRSANPVTNEQVRIESDAYGDIVQEDFLDTYANLTLKTIMIMKWTAEYCSNARFVLKIDDDVIMHTKKVREYLSALGGATSNQFHCLVVWWPQPISEDAKWFMSKDDEYSALLDHYPKYCDSPAYMFSIDLAGRLFNASLYQKKLLRLEDVSMGMLAEKLNASFVDIRSAYYFDQWSLVDFARNHSMRDFFFLYTFSHNSQYPGHFNQTWSLVVNQFT